MEKIYEARHYGIILIVYDECVGFTQRGLLGVLRAGSEGERRVFYKDVSSLRFRKPGRHTIGHITLTLKGCDNTHQFDFDYKKVEICTKMYEYIERKVIDYQNQNSSKPTTSVADELLKYKQLLDSGAITQEEFDTLKRKYLES